LNENDMPKAFTPKQKAAIRAALMTKGLAHFERFGVRKARIEDICRDVGIAKGSFYAFFPSKEALFMTLADERDVQHKADMRAFLMQAQADRRAVLGGFFDFLMERIDTDPVLRIVRDTGELSHLGRTVPPEMLAENARRDREFMDEVGALLRQRHGIDHADAQTLTGLLSLMLALGVQAELIAATADYGAMVALLRDMFISRLLKGPLGDDQGD
jgi:AcrR family transcriptional regulator